MILLVLLFLGAYFAEKIWAPRLDYMKQEKLLLLHYNGKQTRDYLVIVKF
jgi:hypothetical protein